MSTLYAAKTGTPGFTPTIINAGWTYDDHGGRIAAVTSDTSTGTTWWGINQIGGPWTDCLGQWVYGPLGPQTLSGTVTAVLYGATGSFSNSQAGALSVWVSQGATSSIRGTALAATGDPSTNYWNFGSVQPVTTGAFTLSSVVVQNGDYLIIEAGTWRPVNLGNYDYGGLGVGNSRTRFNFSATIGLLVPKGASPTTLWIGQPRRKGV